MSSNNIALVNFREIFLRMIGNYTTKKPQKKTKEEEIDIKNYNSIKIDNTFDEENNHDTLEDIINLLEIIKKEKGLT
jgi:uncharacterized protein YgfB (UPF0149 family)